MSDLANPESPQLQLVNEFTRGFSEGDVNLLAKNLHKDFRRVIYPKSLGVRDLAKEEWLNNMKEIVTFTAELKTTIHSVIEAPGKVITHCTSNVRASSGVDVVRESIYITHIAADEDGSLKIMESEEFTDSQVYLDFSQAATEAKLREQKTAA